MESRHFWVVRFECVFSFVASNWTWSSAAWFVLYFYFFASKWLRGTSSSRFYDGSRNRLCKSTCIYLYIYIYFVSFCPHWNCRLWNVTWAITTQQNMRDYYFAVARTLNLFWSFARLPSFAFHATWASRQSSCQMLRKQTRLAQCRLLWESFLSRTGTRRWRYEFRQLLEITSNLIFHLFSTVIWYRDTAIVRLSIGTKGNAHLNQTAGRPWRHATGNVSLMSWIKATWW